jgi:hypothetical protein
MLLVLCCSLHLKAKRGAITVPIGEAQHQLEVFADFFYFLRFAYWLSTA